MHLMAEGWNRLDNIKYALFFTMDIFWQSRTTSHSRPPTSRITSLYVVHRNVLRQILFKAIILPIVFGAHCHNHPILNITVATSLWVCLLCVQWLRQIFSKTKPVLLNNKCTRRVHSRLSTKKSEEDDKDTWRMGVAWGGAEGVSTPPPSQRSAFWY